MKHCGECSVDYAGDLDRCPLCGAPLTGEPVPAVFPASTTRTPARTARRVLLLISIGCAIILAITALVVPLRPWPTAIAYVVLVINYLVIRNMIAHAPDFMRIVQRYFLVLLAVVVLWWLATGNPYVSSLAVPAVCLLAVLTNTTLVVVYREAFVNDYAKYLVYSLVLGLAPLILIPLGAAPWPIGAYASAGATVLLGAALLIFARRQTGAEMRKLFSA